VLPERFAPFVFASLQSGITSLLASGVASASHGVGWEMLGWWARSWVLAWILVLPVVIIAAPIIQRVATRIASK
jgi:hypothetical protein